MKRMGSDPLLDAQATTKGAGRDAKVLGFAENTAFRRNAFPVPCASNKAKRAKAVARLAILRGLRRNNTRPSELVLRSVPVIPTRFRPFGLVGETFVPGDANEVYRDLLNFTTGLKRMEAQLGPASVDARIPDLVRSVRAVYGFGDPVEPKTRERGVQGFLKMVTGPSPKFSYTQRKLLSKPVDTVGRGVITVNPELTLDEIGLPKTLAWKIFRPHVMRRLTLQGMTEGDAVRHITNESPIAMKALERESQERAVIYSRAPAWHKFNSISGYSKLIDGNAIQINPLVGTGLSADHNGDQMSVHAPVTRRAVQDAKEKILPSRMLHKIRDPNDVMPVPKHEHILGLYAATRRPAARKVVAVPANSLGPVL